MSGLIYFVGWIVRERNALRKLLAWDLCCLPVAVTRVANLFFRFITIIGGGAPHTAASQAKLLIANKKKVAIRAVVNVVMSLMSLMSLFTNVINRPLWLDLRVLTSQQDSALRLANLPLIYLCLCYSSYKLAVQFTDYCRSVSVKFNFITKAVDTKDFDRFITPLQAHPGETLRLRNQIVYGLV